MKNRLKELLEKKRSVSVVPVAVISILLVGAILSVLLMPITEPSIQDPTYNQQQIKSGVDVYWDDQLEKAVEE